MHNDKTNNSLTYTAYVLLGNTFTCDSLISGKILTDTRHVYLFVLLNIVQEVTFERTCLWLITILHTYNFIHGKSNIDHCFPTMMKDMEKYNG